MTTYNPRKAALQYTDSVDDMARQYENGEVVGTGSKLALTVALIRTGAISYVKNTKDDGFHWKGMKDVMELEPIKTHSVAKSDISKACKVVNHYIPNVVTADAEDVVSILLEFTNTHKSLFTAYDAIDPRLPQEPRTPSAWDLVSAMATVVQKARKEGIDPFAVQEAFEAAFKSNFGS